MFYDMINPMKYNELEPSTQIIFKGDFRGLALWFCG